MRFCSCDFKVKLSMVGGGQMTHPSTADMDLGRREEDGAAEFKQEPLLFSQEAEAGGFSRFLKILRLLSKTQAQ